MNSAVEFLSWIFQRCEIGNVNFRFIRAGKTINEFLPLNSVFEAPQEIKDRLEKFNGYNSYFAVALRNGTNGRKDGISEVPALWIDLDGAPIDKIIESPWQPSGIVETSPGKFHVYWKLREAAGREEIDQIENLLKRMVPFFGADRAATDASRLLRLPETLNYKLSPPFTVRIHKLTDLEYNLSDFDNLPEIQAPETTRSTANEGDRLKAIRGCKFLQHCDMDRHSLPEPEWYGMVSILARETGGLDLIHSLSRGYPGYSPQETDRKILHALNDAGPATCERIKVMWDCGQSCGVVSPVGLASKKPTQDAAPESETTINREVSLHHVYDASRMIYEYEAHVSNLDKINFKTGINPIDRKIRGVGGGEVLTIVARAGSFKTTALQNMLISYIQNSAWGAAFFSLEMPVPSVTERFHEMISECPGGEVEEFYRSKHCRLEEIKKDFIKVLSKLFVVPVKVSLKQIPAYTSLIEKHFRTKVGVIGIDYLGLIDAQGANQYEIISRLARGVKSLAKEINLPIILLTQSSRKGGSGQTEVTLDMGRDSGAIEEAADFVIGLFQSEKNNSPLETEDPEYDLIAKILKNRKGTVNSMWKLTLDPKTLRLGHDAEPWTPPKRNSRREDL
jgi:hypothetical protein